MFVLVFKYLTPKGFRGITLFPFILLTNAQDKTDKVMMNHEKIHLKQQLELLILPFYIWYLVEFFIRLLIYRNKMKAYYSICFEREAYANESNFEYLSKRKIWSFWNYLKLKT